MRLIIAMLVLALAVPAFAMLGQGDLMFIENEKGPVMFTHRDHQLAFQCFVCHHDTDQPQVQSFKNRSMQPEIQKCSKCHSDEQGHSTFKKVAHRLCKDCHKKLGGPVKCRDCHKYDAQEAR